MKKYRFFYHYNRNNKAITVHYRGTCYITNNLICNVPTYSKFNKIQPNFIMQGYTGDFNINKSNIIIN